MSDLKATLDTIAGSVTLNPGAAGVAFKAGNELVGTCEVDVRVRDHMVKVDEPTSLGGGDAGPNPVEFALAALASCWAITYRFWSAKLGIPIDKVTIDVEGASTCGASSASTKASALATARCGCRST